ncbi:zinc-binding protein A33-like [Engraulis encrasicolus]|uniref:zinc-binding protein A33-like n=1 Tax=Engraulis encrasicolus TaxID=184585 RepID=UPI002FD304F8
MFLQTPVCQAGRRQAVRCCDQSKHLETLQFLVWLKMKTVLEPMPMTMNPNTAHPELFLSDDLMTVTFIKDNPERFDLYHSVMANEGFDCGIHSWEVEVGNTSRWIVGVMAESAQRTGDFSAQKGRWFLWNNNGLYHARCTPLDPSEVKPEKMPTRIRVWLDFGAGEISFYDPENNVHLHTLKEPFYEKVFPYFNTLSALRIVPIKQPLWGQAPESEQD